LLKQIVVIIFVCISLASETKAPERKVKGNVITSEREPSVRIQLPESVQYVGADRWVLYGMADCELHAFVDTDHQKTNRQKNVHRLYWIQFEGYLPTGQSCTTPMIRLDMRTSAAWILCRHMGPAQQRRDRTRFRPRAYRALIRAKGYKMPAGMMYVRFVHLLDDQNARS